MGTLSQACEVTRDQMKAHFGETPQCDSCRHLHEDGCTCDAFPQKIPEDIFVNIVDHRNAVEGDNGIHWEAKTAEKPQPESMESKLARLRAAGIQVNTMSGGGLGICGTGLTSAELRAKEKAGPPKPDEKEKK